MSIIILNWNGKEYLQDCLGSVFAQTYDNFNVIFVDNHSADGSVDFVRQNFPKAEIIALDENYGFAKGNNIGIKYALEKYNPDYILLLNNDTKIVQKDALTRLMDITENDKQIGILGCKLIFPDGRTQYIGTKRQVFSEFGIAWISTSEKITQETYEIYAAMGAAFLIRRLVIDMIGPLDEGFSPLYYEETDYCVRARRAGFLVKMTRAVEIVHYLGVSSKNQPTEYLNLVFKTNSIRFFLLNFPLPLLIAKIFYECYSLLRNLPCNMLERKNKNVALIPTNLKLKQDMKNNLMRIFTPYLVNIKNMGNIVYKRIFRTEKFINL